MNKERYTFTLDSDVIKRVRDRGRSFGFALSTWVNHILSRSEGLVGDMDWPKKDIDATKDDNEGKET